MKAYLAIKYHANHKNRAVIESISEALERAGIECVCVARDLEKWGQVAFTPAELMQRSFAELDGCDLALIELSEKGVGVGIEAGYAWAKGIPIYTIASRGADISETLRGISREVFLYEELRDLDAFIGRILIE